MHWQSGQNLLPSSVSPQLWKETGGLTIGATCMRPILSGMDQIVPLWPLKKLSPISFHASIGQGWHSLRIKSHQYHNNTAGMWVAYACIWLWFWATIPSFITFQNQSAEFAMGEFLHSYHRAAAARESSATWAQYGWIMSIPKSSEIPKRI